MISRSQAMNTGIKMPLQGVLGTQPKATKEASWGRQAKVSSLSGATPKDLAWKF